MKTAIILHGMPSKEGYYNPTRNSQSNEHWLPWIQRQLILKSILTQTPELPEPYEPVYEKWLDIFEQFHIDENTILVGHSCGAGFLVRWLSENKMKVGKVALVAPFLDPNRDEVKSDFFHFDIDPLLIDRTDGFKIFYSKDDDKEILTSVEQIKNSIPNIQIEEIAGKGHFTFKDMKTDKFPELLAWLL